MHGGQWSPGGEAGQDIKSYRMEYSCLGSEKLTEPLLLGRGLIESIQQDGSRYRLDRRGIQGLNLFTYGQGMMFWSTVDDGRS